MCLSTILSFQVPILLRAENLGAVMAHLTRLERLARLEHSLSKIHSSTTSQERRGKQEEHVRFPVEGGGGLTTLISPVFPS